MAKIAETPLMKQYLEMKEKHPDAILLFRVGDFYETFSEDAIAASQILGITLTRRANGSAQHIELAGFPHHALDTYLPKLVRAGRRVAICEQLEDPKMTKKLVKRGITELVTPGVAINDNILNHKENNFLAAVYLDKQTTGIAFLDISTGEFLCSEGNNEHIDKLLNNFQPKEVLVERGKGKQFKELFGHRHLTSDLDDWIFTRESANERLLKQFETLNLKGFGVQHLTYGTVAAGAILYYLDITQHKQIGHIRALLPIDEERFVRLDRFTVRSLELMDSINEGGSSLLRVIDRTVSPMGARLLRRWIIFPLKDPDAINRRHTVVDYFFRNPEFQELAHRQLSLIGDMERIIARVAALRANPREIVQLRTALDAIGPLKEACLASDEETLQNIGKELNPCEELAQEIGRSLHSDPPTLLNKGGVIAPGINEQLDELRSIAYSGKDYLLKIQQRESERTEIPSLKISYNNVFGYYIEVRNTHKDKVPPEWIRKQTLVNAERYITQELKEYEEKILGAEEKILSLEQRIYNELVEKVAVQIPEILTNASLLAQMDVLHSFAVCAQENRYIRPVVNNSLTISITQGRHPVIEKQLPPGEAYVPNDIYLDNDSTQIMMITGPNMAGKSALLRQTALIVLMAQIGSFVPAEAATIGFVDRVFTRVGASDNISLGESTFMVEMNEAAYIMNNLSDRSLILFDELGRGTSTYDGISIAWAIVEHLHENHHSHPKTLFATHYHELNEMESTFHRIKNFNVSVKEVEHKIIFLRKLIEGGSEHSFGIHVAKLAGMPGSIVNRSKEILVQLEGIRDKNPESRVQIEQTLGGASYQLSLFQLDDPTLCQVRDEILKTDINNLTPIEALNKLNEIKRIIRGKS